MLAGKENPDFLDSSGWPTQKEIISMLEPYQIDLLFKTLSLVGTMVVAGGVAAYAMKDYFSLPLIIGSFIGAIMLIIIGAAVVIPMNSPFVAFPFWALFGATVGADLGGFALAVGRRYDAEDKVVPALGITFLVMGLATLVTAGIALFTGFNFQGLAGVMFFGLLGLIGLGFIALVIRFNRVVETIIGVGASIFWVIYLLVDFNQIVSRYNESSWAIAQQIAVQIYMDLVNLFVQLFPLIIRILDALDS